MFGNSQLAVLNYWMAALYGGGIITTICACFSRK